MQCIKLLTWEFNIFSIIKYKLSITIHKAIHHNSPDYLASLLHLYTPTTQIHTRSSNIFLLTTPHLHNLHFSHIRSFTLSAPFHWNSLPYHLRTLTSTFPVKLHLKTYYFSHVFPQHNNLSHGWLIAHAQRSPKTKKSKSKVIIIIIIISIA